MNIVLLTTLLAVSQQRTSLEDSSRAQRSKSVYHVQPSIDIPLTAAAYVATFVSYAYADHLIKPSCPCEPGDVNAFDQPAIGNHNGTAGIISDVTAGAVLVGPLLLDAIALGPGRAFTEDVVVF